MFLLYAVVAGIGIGLLLGGRLSGLAALEIRWPAAIVGGLLVQVVLFSPPVAARVGDLGPPLYVASTMLVGAAVLRNWRVPGIPLVAVGAASNLAAILANGGSMPAGRAAIELIGGPGRAVPGRLLEQLDGRRSGAVVPHRHLRAAALAAVRERVQRRRPADRDRHRARDRRTAMRSARVRDAGTRHPPRPAGAPGNLTPNGRTRLVPVGDPLRGPKALGSARGSRGSSVEATVQGKPVVRRGRKARDLRREDRPVAGVVMHRAGSKESYVKANLARFTWAVALLASMALSIGAGIRWDWW